MESDGEMVFQLDRDFDKHLADMKPFVLKLPHKTDRQKFAVWIKKLCEPSRSGNTARKIRNTYALLMVQMLKKGSILAPFDQKPETGPLKPLPAYLTDKLPDWVEGELGDTIGSSIFPKSLGNPAATSTWVSSIGEFRERPHTSMGHTVEKDPSLSPIRHSDFVHTKGYSAVTGNDTDWLKPLSSTATSTFSLPKGTTFYDDTTYLKPADREVAVRAKMIEAKFHEEKLKLQQKHDVDVKKILERKNAEIEEVKKTYRDKSKDLEDTIDKLEKKVQTLLKETEFIRLSKDKQISELKKLAEDSHEARKNEFEKRLHEALTAFEEEKFELQKQHTQNIQEILDDTNDRLQRMETEYSKQTTITTTVIKELESRVQQLMNEVDSTLSQRSVVEKEKNDAVTKYDKLSSEYDKLKDRFFQQEREHQLATETHEHELRSLKNKTEASLEYLRQEHSLAASKAADNIAELEERVDQLKKSLKETEEHRQRKIRELEQSHQQDKVHLENLHDKQIRSLKKEMEQLDADWSKKVGQLEQLIKEKDQEVAKLKEQRQQQCIQSELALEEFKSQVERNQARIYDEMKQQMQKVESDLHKSKQTRDKQSKEFTKQIEEAQHKHQQEVAEIKVSFEGEKSQMLREFHMQKEYIISENERDIENLKELHRAEVLALEARLRERQDKSEKAAADSDRMIRELREELLQANQLRKQQLVELGLLREEEKQKMNRDHEAELVRMRAEMEQQRLELQRTHSLEMEAALEKTNQRLKNIEKDFADRASKASESVSELQTVVSQLRAELNSSRETSEMRLAELRQRHEEEKQILRKQYSQNLATIQHELEAQTSRARHSERRLQQEESEHEEKMTELKLLFEEKIHGLLPSEIKQELEDTITSLKSQVNSLQLRSNMLQDELDNRNKNGFTSLGTLTSTPIKSAV